MIWNRDEDEAHRLVDRMAKLMKHELDENFFKGDREAWSNYTLDQAMSEVRYHLEKLENAYNMQEKDKTIENAADVANCAMILLDVLGYIEPEPEREDIPSPPSQPTNNPWAGYSYDNS